MLSCDILLVTTSSKETFSLIINITSTIDIITSVEPTSEISSGKSHDIGISSHYDNLCSSRKSLFNTWCSCCGYIDSVDNTCDSIYLFYCSDEEETINNTQ